MLVPSPRTIALPVHSGVLCVAAKALSITYGNGPFSVIRGVSSRSMNADALGLGFRRRSVRVNVTGIPKGSSHEKGGSLAGCDIVVQTPPGKASPYPDYQSSCSKL